MSDPLEVLEPHPLIPYRVGPEAVTVETVCSPRSLLVALDRGCLVAAEIAVREYVGEAASGDRVVVIGGPQGAFVVGVLSAPRLVSTAASEPRSRVHDRSGRLLFEYDADTDRSMLHAPTGDLEFAIPEGELTVAARDGVKLTGGTGDTMGELTLGDQGVHAKGGSVVIAAKIAELSATAIHVTAEKLESRVRWVAHVSDVIETRAGRIVERVHDAYREVEGIAQTRAKRVRIVAQKAVQIVGENTLLKARNRMKLRGERIHLA